MCMHKDGQPLWESFRIQVRTFLPGSLMSKVQRTLFCCTLNSCFGSKLKTQGQNKFNPRMCPEIRHGKRPQTNPPFQILNQFQGGRKEMGTCLGQNPKGMQIHFHLMCSRAKRKGTCKRSCNCRLSLTGEKGKHLLVFKGPVWTLRRNSEPIFYSSEQDLV